MYEPVATVVVGYGLAGRAFHAPLIQRQPGLRLHGIVARDPSVRAEAVAAWGVRGFGSLEEALGDPATRLVVIATPHDSHAALAIQALDAGRDCVVDKVMALTTEEADRMIAARDRSGKMLSVFHNRRWDWDFLTLKQTLAVGLLGRPLIFESSVCRYAPPRAWRGHAKSAGTILHDWGAHLVDQALHMGLGPFKRLTAWLTPAPWPDVDSGGHGRIVMEFPDALFQVETSRICRLDRPRWWVIGSDAGYLKFGIDPQEDALRAGNLDGVSELPEQRAILRRGPDSNRLADTSVQTVRGSWDAYYGNVADHLLHGRDLAVTAEQARDVVRVLDAALRSIETGSPVVGTWGS